VWLTTVPFILPSSSNLPFPNPGSSTFGFLEIRLLHFADSDQITTTLTIAYTEKILWPLPPARVGTLVKTPITLYSDALSPEINTEIYCYICTITIPIITRIFFLPSRTRLPSFVVCWHPSLKQTIFSSSSEFLAAPPPVLRDPPPSGAPLSVLLHIHRPLLRFSLAGNSRFQDVTISTLLTPWPIWSRSQLGIRGSILYHTN